MIVIYCYSERESYIIWNLKGAIHEFNWQKAFVNTNVNEKMDIFNSTVLNILSNFIQHEFVVCDDTGSP